jgi:hypothetical protein
MEKSLAKCKQATLGHDGFDTRSLKQFWNNSYSKGGKFSIIVLELENGGTLVLKLKMFAGLFFGGLTRVKHTSICM